jgi:hypothetical protein
MNREALRATAPNSCAQPVRGTYGAIHIASRARLCHAVRPGAVLLTLLLVGAGIAAFFLLAGALAPRPSVRIVSPGSETVIPGGLTTVTVEVKNAGLTAATGKGYHLHYYFDAILPITPNRAAIPATGAWASTLRTAYDWDISGVGIHVLAVQVVTSDDRPLNPPVAAAVTVRVLRAAPPSPESSSTQSGGGS